ncbi:MAG: phosphoribosylamine--glycine ligase [Clostridia bacterium]|nr:phosphoribosylamine--glycine ligase [Clostridia bacterium]
MNLLVVGGGGREHAIIRALKMNSCVETIYALPGNAGISKLAECFPIPATDIDGIVDFASSHKIDFAVVAQDDPLALGAVDRLHALGIPCFGPDAKAAEIEASKIFSKKLMKKYGIPTAAFETFSSAEDAVSYLKTASYPIVIKADGLALGKGVVIAESYEDAEKEVREMMEGGKFGKSGKSVVIEEFLTGPEVSVLSFTDGHTVCPMVSSMDHKRANDFDEGLNTGGMGVIAPNPLYTPEIAERCMREIFLPTINAMRSEGRPFKGCLYFGLMLTKNGPKVIEYNCRFGDPEAQAVLPLLKTDLLTVMQHVENETLSEINVEFEDKSTCCVMIASGGYPLSYKKGLPISFGKANEMAYVYHSGTKLDDTGAFLTNGGRVLGVVAKADTLSEAIEKSYAAAKEITFEGKHMRSDIGQRALKGE